MSDEQAVALTAEVQAFEKLVLDTFPGARVATYYANDNSECMIDVYIGERWIALLCHAGIGFGISTRQNSDDLAYSNGSDEIHFSAESAVKRMKELLESDAFTSLPPGDVLHDVHTRIKTMFNSAESIAAARMKYKQTILEMRAAASEWVEKNPGEIHFDISEKHFNVIGGISESVICRVGRDERTRELLRYVEQKSEKQGTIIQLATLVRWLCSTLGPEIAHASADDEKPPRM